MECHSVHLRDATEKQGGWQFALHAKVPEKRSEESPNSAHNLWVKGVQQDITQFKKERNGSILLFKQGIQRQLIDDKLLGAVTLEIKKRLQRQLFEVIPDNLPEGAPMSQEQIDAHLFWLYKSHRQN